MIGAAKRLDALDHDPRAAGPADLRAHRLEKPREVDDLRLARGGLDDRRAFREGRGAHDVRRAEHGRSERAAEEDRRTAKSRGGRHDVAALEADLRTEGLEAAKVQVDRSGAEGASAGHRDHRTAAAGEHGAEDADARPHGADDLVAGVAPIGIDASQVDRVALSTDLHAELGEKSAHVAHVAQVGHVAQTDRLLGEERGRHQRQGGVLRTVDAKATGESAAALDAEGVHGAADPSGKTRESVEHRASEASGCNGNPHRPHRPYCRLTLRGDAGEDDSRDPNGGPMTDGVDARSSRRPRRP